MRWKVVHLSIVARHIDIGIVISYLGRSPVQLVVEIPRLRVLLTAHNLLALLLLYLHLPIMDLPIFVGVRVGDRPVNALREVMGTGAVTATAVATLGIGAIAEMIGRDVHIVIGIEIVLWEFDVRPPVIHWTRGVIGHAVLIGDATRAWLEVVMAGEILKIVAGEGVVIVLRTQWT
jgi:hypothetical protein